MVLNICVNPSFDYTLNVEVFKQGALNRAQSSTLIPGGKGINFIQAAKKLGMPCMSSGFMGEGVERFTELFEKMRIKHKFIQCEGAIRTNVKIVTPDGTHTEINAAGFSVTPQQQNALIELISDVELDMLICSGSLPPGVPDDFYYRLANAAGSSTPFVCDAENGVMMQALRAAPVLVKPNKFELESLMRTELKTYADIVRAAKVLVNRGSQNVLVTLGGDGAIIVNNSSAFLAQYTHEADLLNFSGCGDASLAGACDIYLRGGNLVDMVHSAVALGQLAVESRSVAEMDMEELEGISKNIRIEAIQ